MILIAKVLENLSERSVSVNEGSHTADPMRGAFHTGIVALGALVLATGSAVTGTAPKSPCRIVGAEKLPPETGGTAGICSAVEHAVEARAPNVAYSAEVNVVSASRLTASLIVNGKSLPEQRFAVMDRRLNASAIQHFAEGLATEIAKAAGK